MERVWSSSTVKSHHQGQDSGPSSAVLLLRVVGSFCLAMSLMLLVEKAYMTVVLFLLKCKLIVSALLVNAAAAASATDDEVDLEMSTPSPNYPMVLVQIPMYNERKVYQLSIGAACRLSWPSDRIIVQVLDDSTEKVIKVAVEEECRRWHGSKGVDVRYVTRESRNGYKAGALREGMKCPYAKLCQYVAIFDADFQPDPDFLLRSIPILARNPCVGLVQARWTFVNADECLLTRMQQMSLDYHFTVEQQVGSSTHAFFGFNGTAGVWRISAVNDAGGWKDRTTVEDMDLAVRATLKGWQFLYVHDLEVKSELPSTFKAYRYQQHRWSCGPANLFRKMFTDILSNKKVTVWKKVYVIYSFFFVRKIVAHVVTFVFYCVVVPTAVFFPDVEIPTWGAVYVPLAITILNALGTYPRSSLHLLFLWILFENVMSLHRTKATLAGLLEVGRVNEWVVTEKLGDALRPTVTSPSVRAPPKRAWMGKMGDRLHLLEVSVGAYLLLCASRDLCYGSSHYYLFLFPQALAFLLMGFGYVGTFDA